MTPYTNIEVTDKYIIREFSENIDPIELMWHRDLPNRKITIIKGNGWKFQLDNQLPLDLHEGDIIFIPSKEWHRIFIGKNNMIIKIEEYD